MSTRRIDVMSRDGILRLQGQSIRLVSDSRPTRIFRMVHAVDSGGEQPSKHELRMVYRPKSSGRKGWLDWPVSQKLFDAATPVEGEPDVQWQVHVK